ncbi:MAG: MaoC family dehydratase [Desulfarculus sp.]|nr:MAG: MaoC family dehydratase [Desulfarculus sp.]
MDRGKTIAEITPGQTFEKSFTMTEERIRDYAQATGDNNPIHMDPEAGAKSIFGQRVAQGMLSAGFISGVLGTQFPGSGTIYLSQAVKFLKPVFLGDVITVRLEVTEIMTEKNRLRLATTCRNQRGQEVLKGEAVVMPPKT